VIGELTQTFQLDEVCNFVFIYDYLICDFILVKEKASEMGGGYKIKNQNGIYFITPTIVGWLDVFTRKVYKDLILDSLRYCIEHKGLKVYSYVVMTNHIHLVCQASQGYNLSSIVRDFKKFTTKEIVKLILTSNIESRQEWMLRLLKYYSKYNSSNIKYQMWKNDNHPVELFSDMWISRRINYIHQNPVRAGIVRNPEDYLYSSASNYQSKESILEAVVVYNYGLYDDDE